MWNRFWFLLSAVLILSVGVCFADPAAAEHYAKGQRLAAQLQYTAALTEFRAAAAIEPDNPGIRDRITEIEEAAQERAAIKPCLIVKHKGTIGRRLLWTALIAVPIAPGSKFDLVDSMNVEGAKLKYKTEELDRETGSGIRVIVLPTNYKLEELKEAREECRL